MYVQHTNETTADARPNTALPLTPAHQTFIRLNQLTHHFSLYKLLHSLEQLSRHTIKHIFQLHPHCLGQARQGKGDRGNITFVGDQLRIHLHCLSPPPPLTFIHITQLTHHLSLYKLLHWLEQPCNYSIKQAFMPYLRCIGQGDTDINTANCKQ